MEIELRSLVNRQVVIMGPGFIDNDKLHSVKLLAVEDAGIWIESDEVAGKIIGGLSKKPSSTALAFFIPYSQITTIAVGFEPSGVE